MPGVTSPRQTPHNEKQGLESQEIQLGPLLHEYYTQWRTQPEQRVQRYVPRVVEQVPLNARTGVQGEEQDVYACFCSSGCLFRIPL